MDSQALSDEQKIEIVQYVVDTYLPHPHYYIKDILGCKTWNVQDEIVKSVFKNKYTAVKTCNAIGKSYIAARIVVAYLMLNPSSIVVTTAPTWRQVTDVLWREIGTAVKKSKFKLTDAEVNQAGLNIDTNWFAVGVSTKRPENFFGYHADNILVVVDEAGGVEEPIFRGVAAITPNANARVLLIGNPTDPSGTFFDAFNKPELGYNCITVSAFDSPNFISTGIRTVEDLLEAFTPPEGEKQADWTRKVNAELESRMDKTFTGLISPSVVYSRYFEWGTDSPAWQALIMGEFPSQAAQSLIPTNLVKMAMNMYGIDKDSGKTYAELSGWEIPSGPPSHGQDMARFGDDSNVNYPRRGGWVEKAIVWNKVDLMESATRILNVIDPMDDSLVLNIDDTGNGCVTADTKLLTPDGWRKAKEINVGDKIYSKNNKGKVTVEIVEENNIRHTDVLESGGYKFSWNHVLPYKTRLSNGERLGYWEDILSRKQFIFDSGLNYEVKKKNISLRKHHITMPHGGIKVINKSQNIDGALFAEFLGWYLSEGSIEHKHHQVIISQGKNQHFDRIVELVSMFGKPQIKQAGSVYNVSVFNRSLRNWLKKNCYKNSYNALGKTVPRFVANNSREVINAFLEAFCKGDGYVHKDNRYYVTSSTYLVDDLTELIHKIGNKSGKYVKCLAGSTGLISGRTITRTVDNHVVFECKENKKGNHYGLEPKDIKHTVEQVQSLIITGETHLFYTLVDGAKPIWTHNGGTTDRLRQISRERMNSGQPSHRYTINAYNFSSKDFMNEEDKEKYHDITSFLYWNLRTQFLNKAIALHEDKQLFTELVGRRWFINKSGKIQVESKQEYKERTGGKSPDRSDSLALSFAPRRTGNWRDVTIDRTKQEVETKRTYHEKTTIAPTMNTRY